MKNILQLFRQSQASFVQRFFWWLNQLIQRLPYKLGLLLLISVCLLVPKPYTQAQDILLGVTSAGGPGGRGTAFSMKSNGTNFTLQKVFESSGYRPSGSVTQGNDGNFYGMTERGGISDHGTIFKMTPSGTVTILHNFNFWLDGGAPNGSLIKGADGNFYGMTNGIRTTNGENHIISIIFKITAGGTFTILHQLNSSTEGQSYQSNLVLGADNNFYGFTYEGGTYGDGTIFKISVGGTFTVLHHFKGSTDGKTMRGMLVQGIDGFFYGTNYSEGTYGYGTIFKISSGGVFTVLRQLNITTDGGNPSGNLVQGNDGSFFGTTYQGGLNSAGTIFKIAANGSFTVLHHFNGTNGANPNGGLTKGNDGNFYGTAYNGGTNDYGTIYKITANGTFTVLHNLTQEDGRNPVSMLVLGPDGSFYGWTYTDWENPSSFFKITPTGTFTVQQRLDLSPNGFILAQDGDFYGTVYGNGDDGSIFKLTPSGDYTNLVSFPEVSKVYSPQGSLLQATNGNFYGITYSNYYHSPIYKLCNGIYSTITEFYNKDTSTDGVDFKPYYNSLIQGADGHFYGMRLGGLYGDGGSIFRVTSDGILTTLYSFKYYDGYNPRGSLVQGSDGNFYGTTTRGGSANYNAGSIFKITPSGSFTQLRYMDTSTGLSPHGDLMQGNDGYFYGMIQGGGNYNSGIIFKISSTGTYTILHHLNGGIEGRIPMGSLVQGTDGNFYGMTSKGGTHDAGTIFKMTAAGTLTVLRHFNAMPDGSTPRGSLVQGNDGILYGMTSGGGNSNGGTIFKISTTGAFTVLRHLNPETDGSNPMGSLIIQKADPVAQTQSVSTVAGTAKSITLTATAPGSPLTYAIVSQPKNGTLTGSGSNRTYTPKAGFSGNDAFTFSVTWGCQTSAVQAVSINVTGSNPSVTLTPVADAYVRNGTYGASNYGGNSLIVVKGSARSSYTRTSYLKFSLSNVSDNITSAKLRIYGNNVENTASINLSAYGVGNDSWTEMGITWKNAPVAATAALSTVAVNNLAQYYELDVTGFVQAQLAGDKIVSLLLKDAINQNRSLSFNSKENTDNPPQLLLETTPAANPIRLNSAGGALTTSLGSFSADAYFSSNTSITTTTAAIANTTDDGLYQRTRKAAVSGGSFTYQVPVPNGSYTVRLHLVELVFTASGKRQFNVKAEGETWLTNYDIYLAAGGTKKAVVASTTITVEDGTLNLNFISVIDKASIAALEIIPVATGARLAVNTLAAKANQQISLYPNPAKEKVTLKLSQPAQQITTIIMDITGAKHNINQHQKLDDTTLEIPVSSLPPAVYLLQINTENGKQTLKFIKQ